MDIMELIAAVKESERQERQVPRERACEYFIDPEKRVVVCKLYNTEEGLLDDMANAGFFPGVQGAYDDALIGQVYIGKAVCRENDTFDEEVGKTIAYRKAVKKFNIAKRKRALRIRQFAKEYWQDMDELMMRLVRKYDNVIGNCVEKIASVGGCPAEENSKEGEV